MWWNGQNYLLEVTPVYLEGEHNERVLTGAVAMLRSNRAHGTPAADHDQSGHQRLQPDPRGGAENAPRGGAARKLAMLSAPLLIVGDTGTGKDLLAPCLPSGQSAGGQTLSGAQLWPPFLRTRSRASCLTTRCRVRRGLPEQGQRRLGAAG